VEILELTRRCTEELSEDEVGSDRRFSPTLQGTIGRIVSKGPLLVFLVVVTSAMFQYFTHFTYSASRKVNNGRGVAGRNPSCTMHIPSVHRQIDRMTDVLPLL